MGLRPERSWLQHGDFARLNRQCQEADRVRRGLDKLTEWPLAIVLLLMFLAIVAAFLWAANTVAHGLAYWLAALLDLYGLLP